VGFGGMLRSVLRSIELRSRACSIERSTIIIRNLVSLLPQLQKLSAFQPARTAVCRSARTGGWASHGSTLAAGTKPRVATSSLAMHAQQAGSMLMDARTA